MYQHEPNLMARAMSMIPGPFRGKPVFEAWIAGMVAMAQLLEDQIAAMVWGSDLLSQPLIWGAAVGERPGGLAVGEYVALIRARIIANRCSGNADDLAEVLKVATNARSVRSYPTAPRCLRLYVLRDEFMRDEHARAVARLMESIRVRGHRLKLYEIPVGYFGTHDENPFQYDGGTGPLPLGVGQLGRRIR